MIKLTRVLGLWVLMVLLVGPLGAGNAAWAARIPAGYDVWQTRTINDANQHWTVQFNKEVDPGTANASNIFITDAENIRETQVEVLVSHDRKSVLVTPAMAYQTGKIYRLYITGNVRSMGVDDRPGQYLRPPLVLPFMVKNPSNFIKDISHEYYEGLYTEFKVQTNVAVRYVRINDQELYSGYDKIFEGELYCLEPGDIVTVKAYDGSGKLLDLQEYAID